MSASKILITTEISQNAGQVGDVVDSVLDEATFQSVRGPGWTLMDGKSIVGSRLALLTGWTNLPDSRGRYRRMKDHGAGVNPDGDLAIGALQADRTKIPTTPFTTGVESATHTHGQTEARGGTGGTFLSATQVATTSGNNVQTGTQSANHTHTVTGGGDSETRPKSVTMNTYIKIN
jgi:hypothetical protein